MDMWSQRHTFVILCANFNSKHLHIIPIQTLFTNTAGFTSNLFFFFLPPGQALRTAALAACQQEKPRKSPRDPPTALTMADSSKRRYSRYSVVWVDK